MSKAPSMPMYWDAYLADTTHLTTEEHGAYMLLLGAMWRRNGWVPDDDRDNARILGLTAGKWRKVKQRLSDFLIFESGEITQKKLLETWENTQEKIEKNRVNGAKGGRPVARKNNDLGKANGSNSVNPNETIPEPEPEPDIKEDSSESSKKTPPPKRKPVKRSVALPDGWVPNEANVKHALSKQLSPQEIDDEADRFRDYHLAKGSTFKCWDAAWRTWVGNAIKYRNRGMAIQQGTGGYRQGSSIASIVARRHAGGAV